MADLQCPKCGALMRSIERNGVTIERCAECGGIFLDRGELERLLEAESQYVATTSRGFQEPAYGARPAEHGYGDAEHDRRDYDEHGRPRRKKRGGFLGELLDFGG